jgi:hypothetical protein
MKSTPFIAIAAFLLGSSSLFAKPVDLSEFAGKYNGTTTFSPLGTAYTGSATMVFKTSKNGSRGNLAVSGNFFANGTPYDASNNFSFAKNRTMTIAAVLPPLTHTPLSGRYAVKRGVTINGSATFSDGGFTYPATVSVKIKKTSRRATLTAVYTIFINGVGAYTYTYVGSGKLKK